ncbi:hypothetical protein N9600_01405 [Flavobacteriaceae bacterium]|nr:hypothetical protein [Flavobacteriaceae bacterium]
MNNIILQPSSNKDAREHYVDTIENSVPLKSIESFLDSKTLSILNDIYANGNCFIWGVTPGGSNITKWNRIEKGDVTLFSKSGGIYASAVTTFKIHNKELASHLWGYNNKGYTWEYIYFLDEIRSHNIPYKKFNKAVGYKENYIIQGFGVLDELKSQLVLNEFGLESSTYINAIDELEYSEVAMTIPETEQVFIAKRRLEQGFLRKRLFGNKTNSECSCCKKTYPISMLWCSHIKKRAKCNDEEKRDYNVVLPMCRFGCDELFEKGFIGVDDDGLIIQTKSISNKNIQHYINNLVGNKCVGFSNKNLKYFKWHRDFHK